jgi:hypothetical protein
MGASTPFILGKSRMRKRARTDLCVERPAMVVPTAKRHGRVWQAVVEFRMSSSQGTSNRAGHIPRMMGYKTKRQLD